MAASNMDKNIIYGLYCICHPPDGIRYVGQTSCGANARLGGHLGSMRFAQKSGKRLTWVQNWMSSHGVDNIGIAVLEVCLPDELDLREAAWIGILENLVNIKTGGSSARGWKMPAEAVLAQTGAGNPMYGKDRSELMDRIRTLRGPMSSENRAARRDRLAESRLDVDWEKKRLEGIRKSHGTPEYKSAAAARVTGAGNPMYGKSPTEEHRVKAILGNSHTVLDPDAIRLIRLRAESGERYKDIAESLRIDPSTVSHIMAGRSWGWVK